MKVYENHIFKDLNEYLSNVPVKNESKLMKKELAPLAQELKKYSIVIPNEFVNIMTRFNILRPTINEFMKEVIGLRINGFCLSNRLLIKTNAFEKNIILTYLALFEPVELMNLFRDFISKSYPYFGNKENFFVQINKEIDKIKEKIIVSNADKSNFDSSNSDDNNSNSLVLCEPNSSDSFLEWNYINNEIEPDAYFDEYNENIENDIFNEIAFY